MKETKSDIKAFPSNVLLFRTECNQLNNTGTRMSYNTKVLLKSRIGVKIACVCYIFTTLQLTSFQTFTKYLIHSYINKCNTIQLVHSFEIDIRICQPENSDVHRGEAEVNITFEG